MTPWGDKDSSHPIGPCTGYEVLLGMGVRNARGLAGRAEALKLIEPGKMSRADK